MDVPGRFASTRAARVVELLFSALSKVSYFISGQDSLACNATCMVAHIGYQLFLHKYLNNQQNTHFCSFTPFKRSWNGVILAGCISVPSFVRPSRTVLLCAANKRLYIEALIFAHVCMLARYVHTNFDPNPRRSWPLFLSSKIRIEYIGTSNVIISKRRQIGQTLLLLTQKVACDL